MFGVASQTEKSLNSFANEIHSPMKFTYHSGSRQISYSPQVTCVMHDVWPGIEAIICCATSYLARMARLSGTTRTLTILPRMLYFAGAGRCSLFRLDRGPQHWYTRLPLDSPKIKKTLSKQAISPPLRTQQEKVVLLQKRAYCIWISIAFVSTRTMKRGFPHHRHLPGDLLVPSS